jgi:hypothetical protein
LDKWRKMMDEKADNQRRNYFVGYKKRATPAFAWDGSCM